MTALLCGASYPQSFNPCGIIPNSDRLHPWPFHRENALAMRMGYRATTRNTNACSTGSNYRTWRLFSRGAAVAGVPEQDLPAQEDPLFLTKSPNWSTVAE